MIKSQNQQNNVQKKRGRPKKNVISAQTLNKSAIVEKKCEVCEEIILRIPLFDHKKDTSSDKNIFTMKDDSSEKQSIESLSKSDECQNLDVSKLVEELKKRDNIIKKLQSMSTCESAKNDSIIDTSSHMEKKNKKTMTVNLNLINVKDGQPIIVTTTNIVCWWCTEKFDTMPCFIPEKCTNDKFYVFGCFCSYNCAKSYSSNMGDDYKISIRNSLIGKMCALLYGKSDQIKMAPPREMLKKFGGPMSIEDFRENFTMCNKEYKLNIPVVVPMAMTIDEK